MTGIADLGAIVRGCAIAVLAEAGLAFALLAGGLSPAAVFNIYVLALVAVGFAGSTMIVAARRHLSNSRFEAILEGTRHTPQLRPPGLLRAERDLMLAQSYGDYYDAHLRPLLAEIVSTRLRAGESGGSALARAELGARIFEFLRPDGCLDARERRGLTLSELTQILDAVEAL